MTMIRSYIPINDFFTSALCLGVMFAFGVLSPPALFFQWSTFSTLALFAATTVVVIVGLYFLLFVASSMRISSAICLLLICLPTSSITTFPELLAQVMGSRVFDTDQVKCFNAWHACAVAIIGFVWGYWDSLIQIQRYKERPVEPLRLATLNVYFSDHSFDAPDQHDNLWPFALALTAASLVLVCLFLLPSISSDISDLRILLVRMACMIPTGFYYGVMFLFLGQAVHLIAFERTTACSLKLRDFDERLKWRHDYVKYHLPAPIRKLNLRLFNQHVEAYERLQKEIKTSRT
jgi:hypothetical protein